MFRIDIVILLGFFAFISTPSNGIAGTMNGYMLASIAGGGSNNSNASQNTNGIPFFCFDVDSFDEYVKCRKPSALMIQWVVDDRLIQSNNYSMLEVSVKNSERMLLSDFLNREWSEIRKISPENGTTKNVK